MSGKGIVRTETAGITAALLLPARAARRGLILFASSGINNYTVSDSSSVVDGAGIYVPTGAVPVVLDRSNSGDLVQQALYVIANGASTTFGFIEVVDG